MTSRAHPQSPQNPTEKSRLLAAITSSRPGPHWTVVLDSSRRAPTPPIRPSQTHPCKTAPSSARRHAPAQISGLHTHHSRRSRHRLPPPLPFASGGGGRRQPRRARSRSGRLDRWGTARGRRRSGARQGARPPRTTPRSTRATRPPSTRSSPPCKSRRRLGARRLSLALSPRGVPHFKRAIACRSFLWGSLHDSHPLLIVSVQCIDRCQWPPHIVSYFRVTVLRFIDNTAVLM